MKLGLEDKHEGIVLYGNPSRSGSSVRKKLSSQFLETPLPRTLTEPQSPKLWKLLWLEAQKASTITSTHWSPFQWMNRGGRLMPNYLLLFTSVVRWSLPNLPHGPGREKSICRRYEESNSLAPYFLALRVAITPLSSSLTDVVNLQQPSLDESSAAALLAQSCHNGRHWE